MFDRDEGRPAKEKLYFARYAGPRLGVEDRLEMSRAGRTFDVLSAEWAPWKPCWDLTVVVANDRRYSTRTLRVTRRCMFPVCERIAAMLENGRTVTGLRLRLDGYTVPRPYRDGSGRLTQSWPYFSLVFAREEPAQRSRPVDGRALFKMWEQRSVRRCAQCHRPANPDRAPVGENIYCSAECERTVAENVARSRRKGFKLPTQRDFD